MLQLAARWLESGVDPGAGVLERLGCALWPPVSRRLALPRDVAVVGVGGSTLGGSGRTPLAVALSLALARLGVEAVLVGHAFGGRPRRARVVAIRDRLEDVGDEALLAARRLWGRAEVVVAPTRQQALRFAAGRGRVLVVDRLLQAHPRRLALSLLAVDARAPWGCGRPLPLGDLLAPRARLLDAADEVVRVADEANLDAYGGSGRPGFVARRRLVGAAPLGFDAGVEGGRDAARLTVSSLAQLRLGLVTAVSRPDRVVRTLRGHRVEVRAHEAGGDHGGFSERALRRMREASLALGLDLWLADEKAALRIPPVVGVPVCVLHTELEIPEALLERVLAATGFASSRPAASIPCP